MADNLSETERSALMSKVRHFGTSPELRIRDFLDMMSVSYVQHDKAVPGRPDFVLELHNLVIFVNGCFWHGHNCKKGKRPTSNKFYWNEKIDGNIRRDRKVRRKLWRIGWHVVTIWECQLKKPTSVKRRLTRFINDEHISD
jgi:DNA mismatch endonuclease (patch repair protein)